MCAVFRERDRQDRTAEENRAVVQGSISCFGTTMGREPKTLKLIGTGMTILDVAFTSRHMFGLPFR